MTNVKNPSSSAAALGDKPCIYCGHSLQGLTAQDKCPQCGHLAWHSLLGDHLRDADSGWVRSVMYGIGTIVAGFALFFLVQALVCWRFFDPKGDVFDTRFLRQMVSLGGWMAFFFGAWMVTLPETSQSLLARKRGAAWLLRGSIVVYVALRLAFNKRFEALPHDPETISLVVAATVALLCTQVCLWLVLRRIIDRTPRREVRAMLSTAIAVAIAFSLIVSRGAMLLARWKPRSGRVDIMIDIALMIVAVVYQVFSVYTLRLTGSAIKRTVGYWS